MYSNDTVFFKKSDVLSTTVDDELILLDVQEGEYLTFNSVAARAFEVLENQTDFRTLCETISNEFEVGPDQCKKDMAAFLDELVARKLVLIN